MKIEFDPVYIIFILAFGIALVCVVRSFLQWIRNNNSPKLTVPARVISKRSEVHHHRHSGSGNRGSYTTTSHTYFATFEPEGGDRVEFTLRANDWAMLAQGDTGLLQFQGTRFLSFERGQTL